MNSPATNLPVPEVDLTLNRQSPSVLLMGEVGCGKSHSIRTLLDKGVEKIFVLALEPGVEDVYSDVPKDKLGWMKINPSVENMADLVGLFQRINQSNNDTLQKVGDIGKNKYQALIEVSMAMNKFIDQRNGNTDMGAVFSWPNNWALVIDGLSPLNEMARFNAVGDKPFLDLRDYQVIQNQIQRFINAVVINTNCWFVLTAHLERETVETTGLSVLTLSTIGRKLAPMLPRYFSDMILCERVYDQTTKQMKFYWSNFVPDDSVKLKYRNSGPFYRNSAGFKNLTLKG